MRKLCIFILLIMFSVILAPVSSLIPSEIRDLNSSVPSLFLSADASSPPPFAPGLNTDIFPSLDGSILESLSSTAKISRSPSEPLPSFPNISAAVKTMEAPATIAWIRQFGTATSDFLWSVVTDNSNYVYVLGETLGILPGQTSSGKQDVFVRKYDSAGNVVWSKQFGSSDDDFAGGAAVDSSGNTYVAGWIERPAGSDYFLTKLDSTASVVWTRSPGLPGVDMALAVFIAGAATALGQQQAAVLLTGQTRELPGQVGAGDGDAFMMAYDAAGNLVFTSQFGTSSLDKGNSIFQDGQGNIYVAGDTFGLLGQENQGNGDVFVRKFNPAGNVVLTLQAGTSGVDIASSVGVDGQGNIVVAVHTSGAFPGKPAMGGGWDAFLLKYDSSGTPRWYEQIGTGGDDGGASVVWNGNEYIEVVGHTSGTLPGQTRWGDYDAYLREYNSAGTVTWTMQFGSSNDDFAKGVARDASGNIYVAGYTSGTLPGQTYFGSTDAFLVKWVRPSSTTTTVTATWTSGWVMWSYPLSPDPNTNSEQLGDDISPLYAFHYNGFTNSYDLTPTATLGWGYWVKVNSTTSIEVTGDPLTSQFFDMPLGSSWNQIGSPYGATVAWNAVSFIKDGVTKNLSDAVAAGWVSQWIFSYNTAAGSYETKGSSDGILAPLAGYWIKALQPGVNMRIPTP